jgi:hypothetical protein
MSEQTARAIVEHDFARDGVKIGLALDRNPTTRVIRWGDPIVSILEPGAAMPDDGWLRLDGDAARALYEALADHFGHSGHDARALRKDYDAERGRVDQFIKHLTKATP